MAKPRRGWLSAAFIVVLAIILTAGLWPFGAPRNQVRVNERAGSALFGGRGSMMSRGAVQAGGDGCTVALVLRPRLGRASSTVLAFFGPENARRLSLHQSESDLRIDGPRSTGARGKWYVEGAFSAGEWIRLTVTVDAQGGVAAYRDGRLLRHMPEAGMAANACSGRFVLADAADENDGWQGEVLRLAMYRTALSPAEVATNEPCLRDGCSAAHGCSSLAFLYDLGKWEGRSVHSCGESAIALEIPEYYTIAQQTRFEWPWNAYEPTVGYVADLVLNVAGFVPFGLVLRLLLTAWGVRRAAGVTTVAGFLVSVGIESLQTVLPTRDSDLTDVLTNTLGTWIGVAACSMHVRRRLQDWINPRAQTWS